MEVHDAGRLSPHAQEDLRRRVVAAIVEGGMRQVDAVRTFKVGRTSIYNWLKAYRERGERALQSRPRGRPPRSRLAGPQVAAPEELVTVPLGLVIGGIVRALGGGIAGSLAGTKVTETVYDWVLMPLEKEEWVICGPEE